LSLFLPDADARLRTPERAPLFSVRIAGARWDETNGANILTDALLISKGTR
jgi:hypothetical protein